MITSRILSWVCAGLAVALVVALWRTNSLADQRDDARNLLAMEQSLHSVTKKSVETLNAVIDDLHAQAMERAAAFEAVKAEALLREGELREMAKSSDALIDRLRRIATQQGPGCPVPDELRGILGELR